MILDRGVLKDLQSALTSFGNMMCERDMVVNIVLEMFHIGVWGRVFVFSDVC